MRRGLQPDLMPLLPILPGLEIKPAAWRTRTCSRRKRTMKITDLRQHPLSIQFLRTQWVVCLGQLRAITCDNAQELAKVLSPLLA